MKGRERLSLKKQKPKLEKVLRNTENCMSGMSVEDIINLALGRKKQ